MTKRIKEEYREIVLAILRWCILRYYGEEATCSRFKTYRGRRSHNCMILEGTPGICISCAALYRLRRQLRINF